MRQDYVYVIRLPDTNKYKIGRTVDPVRRFRSLQLPVKPEVVGLFPCPDGKNTERTLHKHFAKNRIHGEWFEFSVAHIALLNFWCGIFTVN